MNGHCHRKYFYETKNDEYMGYQKNLNMLLLSVKMNLLWQKLAYPNARWALKRRAQKLTYLDARKNYASITLFIDGAFIKGISVTKYVIWNWNYQFTSISYSKYDLGRYIIFQIRYFSKLSVILFYKVIFVRFRAVGVEM